MTTIEKLNKELELTKRSIKFANSCKIVIDAINNKSEYEYTCVYTVKVNKLFKNDVFVEWAKFGFTLSSIKHFVEIYKISCDVKKLPSEYTKVINAMTFLLNNQDLMKIANAINKENQ